MNTERKPSIIDTPEVGCFTIGAIGGVVGAMVLMADANRDYNRVDSDIREQQIDVGAIQKTEKLSGYDPEVVNRLAPKINEIHQHIATLTEQRATYPHEGVGKMMTNTMLGVIGVGALAAVSCHIVRRTLWNRRQKSSPQQSTFRQPPFPPEPSPYRPRQP